MTARFIPALCATTLLAACASGGRPPAARPGGAIAQPAITAPAAPQQRGGVIGSNAAALIALFGQPALDVQEGTARKLQFSGGACVLDAYLYPRRERGEAIVTHVDTRSPEGRDAEPTACVAALRRR